MRAEPDTALLADASGVDPLPTLVVSVKALCAFGAKAGDLDLRFVPAPSAQEGIAGHRFVQSRRDAQYESEVPLTATAGRLKVRGRADGYDPTRRRLEEIKTFRGEFDAIRANQRALHWAQARAYAWMLCEERSLDRIDVALVYLELVTSEEFLLIESWTRDALKQDFEALCDRYIAWAEQEAAHRAALDAGLSALAFPHAAFRPGQREMAEGVYRAATAARCLLAQAPTGIGKTVATLFPLLRAWASQRIDKIFFLTAKTSGRGVALDGLRRIVQGRLPASTALRVLELTAREKACEYPGRACHGDACPLARGFYDRLPAARAEAVEVGWLDRGTLRGIAQTHAVCPYFLAQDMARWADVVVADYNYYFDGNAFLYALTKEEEWRVAVLVDEAHNLLDRARGMYTARIDADALRAVRFRAPMAIKQALARLDREWQTLQREQARRYHVMTALPPRLARALQDAVGVLAEHFSARPQDAQGPLQERFFEVLQFARLTESFGRHSVLESQLDVASNAGASGTLTIRNLVPAPFLRPRFEGSLSSACFSGTLAPFDFYRDTLGLPDDTATVEVASPFQAAQLEVRVATRVSTRWRDRAGSLAAIVDIMAAQYAARPGNYLAFFSSFDYLDRALECLATRHPQVPRWQQTRQMREPDRDAFVARFTAEGRGIGFAVLGGPFGEGIDLPGDRLIGAFIASLGMPQHDEPNEVMRERMHELFGDGYAYTYLYPGLQKVVQAAGRVIRSEADSGVLVLMDDRFDTPGVRALLPPWWEVRRLEDEAVGVDAEAMPARSADRSERRRRD